MHTYNQLTGEWLRDGQLVGEGYSGHDNGKNNPELESLKDVGPIPCGRYTIMGPPYQSARTGRDVLKLLPSAETRARIVAMGRDPDSFELHGDSIETPGTASHGCVILPNSYRWMVWNSKDVALEVVSGIDPGLNPTQKNDSGAGGSDV